jgi:uncharacterized NAD-dependent epimerase/dehydratase family protein
VSSIETTRRLAVLAAGHLDFHFGKTAMGLIRYRSDEVVAVIDADNAGRTTEEAVGHGGDTPIVSTLTEALSYEPTALLIGIATRGGFIPPEWRPVMHEAIDSGLDIISGLHSFLSEDPDLRESAEAAGVELIDLRRPPSKMTVAANTPHRVSSTVITLVGSDCAVGKMSVALDIEREAHAARLDFHFLATGQTGIMISGKGVPLDRVIGDFMSGAVEDLVVRATEEHDVVLVEGQGALLHPAYSGVTLALIHGSAPDAMILTVMPGRDTIDEYTVPIPSLLELVEMHEAAAGWIKPAPVIAIAVNSLGLTDKQAQAAVQSASAETGLPATDTFRFGAAPLLDAISDFRRRYADS